MPFKRCVLRLSFDRKPYGRYSTRIQTYPGRPCSVHRQPGSCAQAKIAEDMGVSGTPFFFVKGQAITGFDRERLAALLTEHKE